MVQHLNQVSFINQSISIIYLFNLRYAYSYTIYIFLHYMLKFHKHDFIKTLLAILDILINGKGILTKEQPLHIYLHVIELNLLTFWKLSWIDYYLFSMFPMNPFNPFLLVLCKICTTLPIILQKNVSNSDTFISLFTVQEHICWYCCIMFTGIFIYFFLNFEWVRLK